MVPQLKEFAINFLVSGSAAVISKTLIAPVERTKFILQNQESALQILTGEREKYTGILDVLRRIPQEQGVLSFWRGNATNLIRYFPSQALNFSFYQYYKQELCLRVPNKLGWCELAAGGLAGASSTCIVFPLDFCQTRLTVDIGSSKPYGSAEYNLRCSPVHREFTGLLNCLSLVSKKDGIAGLYYGIHMSVFGLALYRSIYFGLYDYITNSYKLKWGGEPNVNKKVPVLLSFLIAQSVTAFSGFLAYPFDTVSRRMMLDSGRPLFLRKSPTALKTMKHIFKETGIVGFYKGGLTNMVRCTAGALVLVLYNEFVYYTKLQKKH